MDFCYFERELEVFSDEEGVYKSINGYCVGDLSRGKSAETKLACHESNRSAVIEVKEWSKEGDSGSGGRAGERRQVPKPELIAPEVHISGTLRILENPVTVRPENDVANMADYDEREKLFVRAEYIPHQRCPMIEIENPNTVWEDGVMKRKYFLQREINPHTCEKESFALTPEQERQILQLRFGGRYDLLHKARLSTNEIALCLGLPKKHVKTFCFIWVQYFQGHNIDRFVKNVPDEID